MQTICLDSYDTEVNSKFYYLKVHVIMKLNYCQWDFCC